MNKTIKLIKPIVVEWIYAKNKSIGLKQDGFKNDANKFHISELSQQEAEEYAEAYKQAFLDKFYSFKEKTL